MAYLVLAAGAVMVLIGAVAVVTGYPIIQVERGWATVIAGTSLLVGGVVTMAMALVLRALIDLRLALATPHAEHAVYNPTAADHSMEPSFASRNAPIPSDATYPDLAPLGLAAAIVPAATLSLHETDTHASNTHPADEAAHAHADPQDLDVKAHDGQAASLVPVVDEKAIHEDSHEATHESSAPGLDDWLDRAFADLHEPVPLVAAETRAAKALTPEPSAADQYAEHAPATQLHDDHVEAHAHADEQQEAHATSAGHTEPADAAPIAGQATSAVIGRYEADGTSYTMYADGSIDAQSDVGVYRFASMAELKAFIEG